LGKARILVVEDEHTLVSFWKMIVEGRAEIIWADNLVDAEKIFVKDQDFDFMVMDCCVPGRVPNSFTLVEKIRESGYTKPIIAKSASDKYAEELLEFGASHMAVNGQVHELILELLDEITN